MPAPTELLVRPTPADIVETLPPANYTVNYQPEYPDKDELVTNIAALQETQPVTTFRQVDALQSQLTDLATGRTKRPLIITASCAESVDPVVSNERRIANAVQEYRLVLDALPDAIAVQRNRGQVVKPRSSAIETLPDGHTITSYMGDGINDKDAQRRTPDPTRLVHAAEQSRDLENGLTDAVGQHVPAAHEALSLPYERAFLQVDPETGKTYLTSADLPWAGMRTNQCSQDPEVGDSPQVELLEGIANPVGIKIGADTTSEHIAALQAKLNPDNVPGKLVFMLRTGPQNIDNLHDVLAGIRQHSPHAIILYDIHGVTRTAPSGVKIRSTEEIVQDIEQTAAACRKAGLKLHGLHLETVMDDTRLECVDEPDQLPKDPGNVDPRLNPRQLRYVLEQTQDDLL